MRAPIVYVIKEQMARGQLGPVPMDYSPAMKYGEIRFVSEFDLPLYDSRSVQAKWNEDVANFVNEYDPMTDFIITTGQPIAIFAVGYLLGMAGKPPRFLAWRRESNDYRVVAPKLLNTLAAAAA